VVRKEIIWSVDAEYKFGEILNYLDEKFGTKSATDFALRTNMFLDKLSIFPELGSIEVEELNIRGFVLHPNTKLFYTIENNAIILITFFLTKQNPENTR